MQRHQSDQQVELVRYLHELNQWLARDVNNRQRELQRVENRMNGLQASMLGGVPGTFAYAVYNLY